MGLIEAVLNDLIRTYDWPWRRDCFLEGVVIKVDANLVVVAVTRRVKEGREQRSYRELSRFPQVGKSNFDDLEVGRILILRHGFEKPKWADERLAEVQW